MKFFVNDDCIGCGLCAATCPDVFQLGEEGTARAIDADITGAQQLCAVEAEQNCPVNAIQQL